MGDSVELTVDDKLEFYYAFRNYVDMYGHRYPKTLLMEIERIFHNDINGLPSENCNVTNQIYAEIGYLPEQINIYKGVLEVIRGRHDIYVPTIDICAGYFPNMSKYIDEEQRAVEKGSVTAYDPNLVTTKLGNVELVRRRFTEHTPTRKYDLFVSVHPCKATEMIIRKANGEGTEFTIAVCGCLHPYGEHATEGNLNLKDRYKYLYKVAKETLGDRGEIFVDYLDNRYCCPYPILSSRVYKR